MASYVNAEGEKQAQRFSWDCYLELFTDNFKTILLQFVVSEITSQLCLIDPYNDLVIWVIEGTAILYPR